MQKAEHILGSGADPSDLSVARQAIGIVLRHRGLHATTRSASSALPAARPPLS